MHGVGTLKYSGGDEYSGEWKNDKKDGVGTLKYSGGDIYVGRFNNNVKHGLGQYTYSDGRVVKGIDIYSIIIIIINHNHQGIFEYGEFSHM